MRLTSKGVKGEFGGFQTSLQKMGSSLKIHGATNGCGVLSKETPNPFPLQ